MMLEAEADLSRGASSSGRRRPRGRELLVARSLRKSFPGTLALDGVDLTLHAGQITALAGHNGSGKSTLVKILAGVHRPDAGTISDGEGDQGWRERIHFIHQDLGLIDGLTVIENLDLGRALTPRAWLPSPLREERRDARELLATFDIDIDVDAPVRTLSPAERTVVAIARALADWPDNEQVLVLDEPTASLQGKESEKLVSVVAKLAERGAAVLYISHRLGEITELADDVLVLRDGRCVAHLARGQFDADHLVELIAGHAIEETVAAPAAVSSPVRLQVTELSGVGVRGVDLEVRRGEIVGLSGVIGSGIEDLLGLVFGAVEREGGRIRIDGEPVAPRSPKEAVASGLGFVPRDRHRHGAVVTMSGRENLTLPRLSPLRRILGAVDVSRERRECDDWFHTSAVHPHAPERTFAQFSGGNQQKIVLSKWLRTDPSVLLLEEPTQGVDVGAKDGIHDLVRQAASAGSAVLVASSDTKELVALCSRVYVITHGRISAVLEGSGLTEPHLVRLTLSGSNELPAPQEHPAEPVEERR